MDNSNLLSVKAAAKYLGGISPSTINAWLSQGRLERVKVGSRTMVRESSLQKMIQPGGKSPAPIRKSRQTASAEAIAPDSNL